MKLSVKVLIEEDVKLKIVRVKLHTEWEKYRAVACLMSRCLIGNAIRSWLLVNTRFCVLLWVGVNHRIFGLNTINFAFTPFT